MFGNFGKLFGKVDAVFSLLGGLGKDMADVKATVAAIERDIADVKPVLAEVRALTGHTAAAVAATPAAPHVVVVPSSGLPVVTVPQPAPGLQTDLKTDLKADVAKVDPLAGVKMP